MTTYKISFYPGMVMPKPYYVAVDEPTTDYQALMDILADRLSRDSVKDGLFDDSNKCPDDEICVCGNEGRRLKTGGMLDISEVTPTDIAEMLKEKIGTDYPIGNIDIGFKVNDAVSSETQLDCENAEDLAEIWSNFCKENDLDVMSVTHAEPVFYGQMYTERGLISVKGQTEFSDIALKNGYSYSFHSSALGYDVYGKTLDERGLRHQFILVSSED